MSPPYVGGLFIYLTKENLKRYVFRYAYMRKCAYVEINAKPRRLDTHARYQPRKIGAYYIIAFARLDIVRARAI